jgi:hypothetical protein
MAEGSLKWISIALLVPGFRGHTAVPSGEGFRRRVQPPTTLVERPSDSLYRVRMGFSLIMNPQYAALRALGIPAGHHDATRFVYFWGLSLAQNAVTSVHPPKALHSYPIKFARNTRDIS